MPKNNNIINNHLAFYLKPFSVIFISSLLYVFSNICFASDNSHNSHKSLVSHDINEQFIAVVPELFPPFYHVNNEQKPYGMAIEVMNELDHNAGFLTKFIVKKSWAEVFKAIDTDEAQIIPNLGITEARKRKYFFTKPYAQTKIHVFTRSNSKISKFDQILNLNIGVVKNNIGSKIAKANNLKNTHQFKSIEQAYTALLKNEIDVVIYPLVIALKSANKFNISHLIRDSKITLSTIDRAIAVSKKHPALYKKINTSLNNYLDTQDYKDTYFAWYGKETNNFSLFDLILFNIFVLIFSVAFINYYWKKKNFTVFNNGDGKSDKTKTVWVATLISILITATSIVTFSTLWVLYETSFNEQRLRLIDSVKSRARLIEAIARYDQEESKLHNRDIPVSHERTIAQVIDAHKNFAGFGETGEFTLAKKGGDQIEFILRQRHSRLVVPKPVSFDSKLAAPMRLALFGHSGTIVGPDYRGEMVLAAYEPVSILNLGIVAKIDITEIREPFIRSALYILSIAIIVSLLGSLLFFYIIIPIINKIKETEQQFHKLFEDNYSPILLLNPKNAQIKDANKAAIDFYGYNKKELISYNLDVFSPIPIFEVIKELQLAQEKNYKSLITKHRLQNGEVRDIEMLMSPVSINKEAIIQCTIIDITLKKVKEEETKQLQKEIEQARKMEALGQLTGGIAHDFNNMLGIIMGYTELSLEISENNKIEKIPSHLRQILSASNRAKELIASMMLFSRTDNEESQITNISPLVKEDIKMLRSIIPTSIDIITHIDTKTPDISIEPIKLQQLIMNLCVNARDAMESKGTLTVNLQYKKHIHDNCLICYQKVENDWVELSITDTGSGMTEEIKQHLFEPFFTTKEKGKGTGMGMAVVHGIVKSLNGHILIDSEVGQGTTIRILFKPIQNKDEIINIIEEKTNIEKNNNERILIVDDNENLLSMIGDTLELYGYQCLCFSSSKKALEAFTESPDAFDLIFSDQTMPDLTGLEMIKKMRYIRIDIPAIIVTGYSESINPSIAKENNIELYAKPLAKEGMLKAVSNIFTK